MRYTAESFIERAKEIHGDKYDYSKVNYINCKTKVCIICPEHGKFWQTPDHHLRSIGCPRCKDIIKGFHHRKSFEQFKKRAAEKHGSFYTYPEQKISSVYDKLRIICPRHGEFMQSAHGHLRGAGCPFCSSSRGEKAIKKFLNENSISFVPQKAFESLKIKKVLRYDFYLPEKNLLIEYNGRQHYEPVERFGGKEQLRRQRHHDWLKRKFARDSGIRLLTIPYTQFNMIEEILKENL